MEEAENGEEGLRKARANIPDLILCDLDMPVMDGCETLEHLRNDPILSGVPVIVVSGTMTAESERWVMRAGARAVLTKPFSLDALTSLLRRYLNTGKDEQA